MRCVWLVGSIALLIVNDAAERDSLVTETNLDHMVWLRFWQIDVAN